MSPTRHRIDRVLIAGDATGPLLALDEPLSFWGGFDAETGAVIDQAHPQAGSSLAGRVVLLAVGRGSSSASSVLAEAIRAGTAPAALVMREPDEIVHLGAIVADELYGAVMPLVLVEPSTFTALAEHAVGDVDATVTARPDGGSIEVVPPG